MTTTKLAAIVNIETGKVTYQDLSEDYINEQSVYEAEKAELMQKELDKAAQKVALLAKLAALGLTTDDLKALGL